MEIHISIHTREPLAGTASVGSEEGLRFDGWLELLRALSTLLEACEHPDMEQKGGSHTITAGRGQSKGRGIESK